MAKRTDSFFKRKGRLGRTIVRIFYYIWPMYRTLAQNTASVASALLSDPSNPITGGRGSFVRSDYDEREGFANIPEPYIIWFDAVAAKDVVNSKDTWTVSVGFYKLATPDMDGAQTDAILSDMDDLVNMFIKQYRDLRADVTNVRSERAIKDLQGTLTGWVLTFNTTTRKSC